MPEERAGPFAETDRGRPGAGTRPGPALLPIGATLSVRGTSDRIRGPAELGCMSLPEAWGCGYTVEACAAARDWFADTFPQRAGGALHSDRQLPLDAPRGEAGAHRGGAVRGVRRRAVVRRVALGHAVRLRSYWVASSIGQTRSRSAIRAPFGQRGQREERRGRGCNAVADLESAGALRPYIAEFEAMAQPRSRTLPNGARSSPSTGLPSCREDEDVDRIADIALPPPIPRSVRPHGPSASTSRRWSSRSSGSKRTWVTLCLSAPNAAAP